MVVHDGHRGPREIGVQPEFLAWLTDPEQNGAGALFDFGCYGANLMTWLMDDARPTSVTAVTRRFKPEIYPRVDDEATIILEYPGAQAIIQASWNWPFDRKDMAVYGQTGSVFTVRNNEVRVRRAREAYFSRQQRARAKQRCRSQRGLGPVRGDRLVPLVEAIEEEWLQLVLNPSVGHHPHRGPASLQ